MRVFTEEEMEKYYRYLIEVVVNEDDIKGRCAICGEKLDDVELPSGPERKVTCLKDRDYFEESFDEAVEFGEITLD